MTSTNNTIKFNVGGKHFEVSRDLIEKHSETMLGKIVSEAWQADPEEAVFIDRNGDIFAYVLDYLRYGSIELPLTTSRSSFERDLDFYGLAPKEGDIKNISITDVVESLQTAKSKHDMFLLALEAHHQYVFKKESSHNVAKVCVDNVRANLGIKHKGALSQAEKELFLKYLDEYFGLRMATTNECSECGYGGISHPHNPICTLDVFFTLSRSKRGWHKSQEKVNAWRRNTCRTSLCVLGASFTVDKK